jgi:hypothetical protein
LTGYLRMLYRDGLIPSLHPFVSWILGGGVLLDRIFWRCLGLLFLLFLGLLLCRGLLDGLVDCLVLLSSLAILSYHGLGHVQ